MTAYYNEFEPYAAQWLRNLINAGLIAPGDVDERDLNDVHPDDLRPYTQVHLCAGIGVWSRGLRNIGWPDDKPIWSASFPCQPFSAAGQGMGFADERHLWPTGFHLITQCRPPVIVGEQVASKDGLAWLDLVQTDLERADYAFGAVDTCAAGVGAPHIRQRGYWIAQTLADTEGFGRQGGGQENCGRGSTGIRAGSDGLGGGGTSCFLGDPNGGGRNGEQIRIQPGKPRQANAKITGDGRLSLVANSYSRGNESGLAHADGGDAGAEWQQRRGEQRQFAEDGGPSDPPTTGPTNGYWRDADWLFCRDGKWRPVEPGTFPLAHAWNMGNRVGMLRAAGNAINIAQAEAFLAAALT